jgi:hypothetical protein
MMMIKIITIIYDRRGMKIEEKREQKKNNNNFLIRK